MSDSGFCTSNADCSSGFSCIQNACQKDSKGLPIVAWIGIGVGALIVVGIIVAVVIRFCRMKRRKTSLQSRMDHNSIPQRQGPAPLPAGYMKPVDLLQVAQVNQREQQRLSMASSQFKNSSNPMYGSHQMQHMDQMQGQIQLMQNSHIQNHRNSYMPYMDGSGMRPPVANASQNRYSYAYPVMYDYTTGMELQSAPAVVPIPTTYAPMTSMPLENSNLGNSNYYYNDQLDHNLDGKYSSIYMNSTPDEIQSNSQPNIQDDSSLKAANETSGEYVKKNTQMKMIEKRQSLLLDTGSAVRSSTPASPSRTTPLIEFSPVNAPFNVGKSPTDLNSPVKVNQKVDTADQSLSSRQVDGPISPVQSKSYSELVSPSKTTPLIYPNDPNVSRDSPTRQEILDQNEPEIQEKILENPPSPPLHQELEERPAIPQKEISSVPALPPRQTLPAPSIETSEPVLPEENQIIISPLSSSLSDEMSAALTTFSAESHSQSSFPESLEETSIDASKSIDDGNIHSALSTQVSSETLNEASSITEPVIVKEFDKDQSIVKVPQDNFEPSRSRPAGGRPLPSHMKF